MLHLGGSLHVRLCKISGMTCCVVHPEITVGKILFDGENLPINLIVFLQPTFHYRGVPLHNFLMPSKMLALMPLQ